MSTPSFHIDTLLSQEGFADPDARTQARAALEAHGLTRPGKTNIAHDKLARVRAVLAAVIRVCDHHACGQLAQARWPTQTLIRVERRACAVCGGSNALRAVQLMIQALEMQGVRRLLIVGGAPDQARELCAALAGASLEVRRVEGTGRAHTAAEGRAQIAWCQLVIFWSNTPLKHKVSVPYAEAAAGARRPVVSVGRPGLEALCRAVIAAVERGGTR